MAQKARKDKSDSNISERLTIGLLIDWVGTPYHVTVVQGVQSYTDEHDINLICYVAGQINSIYEWDRNKNFLYDIISKRHIDGLIIAAPSVGGSTTPQEMAQYITRYNQIPMAAIGNTFDRVPGVLIDNQSGMENLVKHLIEIHGFSRYAYISGPENNPDTVARYKTFREMLSKYGIPFDEDAHCRGNFLLYSGIQAVKTLLDERIVNFDVIVAANDAMAAGAIEELTSRGINVPNDVAVVGFDNAEVSRYVKISTVKQPVFEQGRKTVELLVSKIRGEKVPETLYLPTKMIIRESCGCFNSPIKNIDIKLMHEGTFKEDFRKSDVLKAILKECNPQYNPTLRDYIEVLFETYIEDISGASHSGFLNTWNKVFSLLITSGFDFAACQSILYNFSSLILPQIKDPIMSIYAENLLQLADQSIESTSEKNEIYYKILSDYHLETINNIGELLATTYDINKQMEYIFNTFPSIGIKSVYLSLFEDPSNTLGNGRLILSFDENDPSARNAENTVYDIKEILPQAVFPPRKKYSLIIQDLYIGNEQIGLLIISMGTKEARIYDILRNKISIALKTSMLVGKIRNQAENLEEEVKERTIDLMKTNEALTEEINERKKVENQLKKAMDQLEESNQQLHNISIQDPLTSLYNRRGFFMLGERYYQMACRSREDFLVLFADLDGLKHINDTFGHKEGDNAIMLAAKALQEAFRKTDIIGRVGGDEFTIIAPKNTLESMAYIQERLQDILDKENDLLKKAYTVSISFGAAMFNATEGPPFPNFEEILSRADKELYMQKKTKKEYKGGNL